MRPYNDEAGDWQGLDSPTQTPRYTAIADMLNRFNSNGSVLDVGCGKGILRTYLPKDCQYTGIEPSAAAVRIALERCTPGKIIHTRAEIFDARGERFDSIVFNEMLYYAANRLDCCENTRRVSVRKMLSCALFTKGRAAFR